MFLNRKHTHVLSFQSNLIMKTPPKYLFGDRYSFLMHIHKDGYYLLVNDTTAIFLMPLPLWNCHTKAHSSHRSTSYPILGYGHIHEGYPLAQWLIVKDKNTITAIKSLLQIRVIVPTCRFEKSDGYTLITKQSNYVCQSGNIKHEIINTRMMAVSFQCLTTLHSLYVKISFDFTHKPQAQISYLHLVSTILKHSHFSNFKPCDFSFEKICQR